MNEPNDTQAIVAANLRMVRALSPEEWRQVNTSVNQLYRFAFKGRTIPYPEGVDTFEEAARYRLAHLAARILLDLAEHAALTEDGTNLEHFLDAIQADGRVPESLLNDVGPVLANVFDALAPAFIDMFRAGNAAAAAVGELAEAVRDE